MILGVRICKGLARALGAEEAISQGGLRGAGGLPRLIRTRTWAESIHALNKETVSL